MMQLKDKMTVLTGVGRTRRTIHLIDYLWSKRGWVLKEKFKILTLARSEPQTVGYGVISMNTCSPAASLKALTKRFYIRFLILQLDCLVNVQSYVV